MRRRASCSASHRAASVRKRRCFVAVTASTGAPNLVLARVFTSQKTSVESRRTTRSSSPSRQRQLRSSNSYAAASYHRATASSPAIPSRRRGSTRRGPGPGTLQVLARQFLDVDVLERHDPHVGDEPGGSVHVPDPRVLEVELEVDASLLVLHVHLDGVREIEASFGLDDVREHREDVAILLVELELYLGLVPLEVLGAHLPPCRRRKLRLLRVPVGKAAVTADSPDRRQVAGSGPPLPDLGCLPDPVAQVVELRPADVAAAHDLDPGDDRRVHGESAFDADAEAHLADSERLARTAALAADHDPLEHLHALTVALHHPDVHLQRVAGREVRNVVPKVGAIDKIGCVHRSPSRGGRLGGEEPRCYRSAGPSGNSSSSRRSSAVRARGPRRSGRRSRVRRSACARRQRAIRAWSPVRNASGTGQPRKSAGRVYCGYSSNPAPNDSSSPDSVLPITPGTRRATASITTSAAASPPAST